jgi:hypothetical protein
MNPLENTTITPEPFAFLGLDPGLFFIVVIGIALMLTIRKPFYGFLFCICILCAFSTAHLAQVRTFLGSYLNLIDVLAVIMVIGLILDLGQRQSFGIPLILFPLFLCLAIGMLLSVNTLGITYENVRTLKWAFTLPVFFILSYNAISSPRRARDLVVTVIIGTIILCLRALLQLIITSRSNIMVNDFGNPITQYARAYNYRSAEAYVFLALFVWVPFRARWTKFLAMILLSALCTFAIIIGQWRSEWIAIVVSLPLVIFLLRQESWRYRITYILSLFGTAFLVVLLVSITPLGNLIFTTVGNRLSLFISNGSFVIDAGSGRLFGALYDFYHWLDSPIIGNGLAFQYRDYHLFLSTANFMNHLGYLLYLSQMGIIGFITYALVFPVDVLKQTFRAMRSSDRDIRVLAVLAGCCAIYSIILPLMDASYLGFICAPGILLGSLYGVISAPAISFAIRRKPNSLSLVVGISQRTNPVATV